MARQDELKSTSKYLKKIIGGKGKVLGNFYFAGDALLRDAGLIVTLTRLDKKGKKVETQGKAVRKEIKGAKFARGIVKMDGARLVFEVHTGTAAPSAIKNSFRKVIIEKYKINELRFLAKATIRAPGGSGEDDDEGGAFDSKEMSRIDDEIKSLDKEIVQELMDAGMNEEEALQEVKLLAAEGPEMTKLVLTLQENFLSVDSAAEDMLEQIEEYRDAIENEKKKTPRDDEKIRELTQSLAEAVSPAPVVDLSEGTTLSEEDQLLLQAAIEDGCTMLIEQLQKSFSEIERIHRETSKHRPLGTTEEPNKVNLDWTINKRKNYLPTLTTHSKAVDSYRSQLKKNIQALE